MEDLKLHQQQLQDVILRLGHNILGVYSAGEDAVDFVLRSGDKPDLLILDITLEGKLNGFQVAEKINSELDIPIIFLTSSENTEMNFSKSQEQTACVYLKKTYNQIDQDSLQKNIELALYKHRDKQRIQASLLEQELLLDTIDTQIWYLIDAGTYGRVNQAHADFLGLDKTDIEYVRIDQILSQEEADVCQVGNKKVFQEKEKVKSEEWLLNNRGEKRLLSITKNPKLNERDEVEYVVCSAEDITQQKKEEVLLKQIVDYSERFMQMSTEDIDYQEITDNLLQLSGAKYAVFNLFDKDGEHFTTKAISGNNKHTEKALSMLGLKLRGRKWPPDPERSAKIKARRINKLPSLIELVDDTFSKKLIKLINKRFALGEVVIISITKDDKMLGDFTIIMDEEDEFNRDDIVKIYTRHLGILITRKQLSDKLKASEERYRTMFDAAPIGIMLEDEEGKILEMNEAHIQNSGYSKSDLVGRSVLDTLALPEHRELARDNIQRVLAGEDLVFDIKSKRNNDEYFYTHIKETSITLPDGSKGLLSMQVDITDRVKMEAELRENKDLLEKLTAQVPGAVYQFQLFPDGSIKFPYALGGIHEFHEIDPRKLEMDASEIFSRIHPDDYVHVAKSIKESAANLTIWHEEYRVVLPEKGVRWLEGIARPEQKTGGSVLWHGYLRDVTERIERQNEIKYLLYRDSLTDLYNRRFFEEEMIRLDTQRQLPLSLIMADINGLKIINDSFGHARGDELLVKTAEILKEVVREEDILARWAGDEFALLLPKTDQLEAQKVLDRIKAKCSATENDELPISIGIGMATKIDPDQSLSTVLKEADDEMYQNKLLENKSTKSRIVRGLLNTLGAKSDETEEHAMRMAKLAYALGKKLGLSNSELNRLSLLASLHDIGKTSISEDVLVKSGKLTPEEWEMIKEHPERGYRIASASDEFSSIAEDILSHHERWDGKGYPRGLKGEDIPYLARIIAIVDAYDVMTSGRPYQAGIDEEEALAEIRVCAGSQFDPVLAQEFVELLNH
ncbi:MAG: HD domain-containing phosphohydrolase [Bacillota bacterium]